MNNFTSQDENTFDIYLRSKTKRIDDILNEKIIHFEDLKSICWGGIPAEMREKIYPILLNIFPLENSKRETFLEDLKTKYDEMKKKSKEISEKEKKQILLDIKRLSNALKISIEAEETLIDVLTVYTYFSPEVGYVQAMSDLISPFIFIFNDGPFKESLIFYCVQNFIDNQKRNLIGQQEGTNELIEKLNLLLKTTDPQLYKDLIKKKKIDLNIFSFRWFNCCFVREFNLNVYFLILDTLLTTENYRNFCICLAACILRKFRNQILEITDFEALKFLQELKLVKWRIDEILEILSYVYMDTIKYASILLN